MQLFTDNMLHGDLHPGNIMLLKKNRFAFIDFGSVSILDTGFLEKYKLTMKAITERNYAKYAEYNLTLAPNLPRNIDIGEMCKEVVRQLQKWEVLTTAKGVPYEKRSLGAASAGLVAIFGKYRLPAQWNTLRAGRSMGALDASLRFLIPEVNIFKLNRRYYEKAQERTAKLIRSKRFRQEATTAVGEILRIPGAFGEDLMFQGQLVAKQAMNFQAGISKTAAVGKALLTPVLHIGLIAAVLMIARYLSKQNDVSQKAIAALPLRDVFGSMPHFPPGVWILVIVLTLFLLRRVQKLIKILMTTGVGKNPFL